MSSSDSFDAEAHGRLTAALIGLPIAPDHMPGVVQDLLVAARMAAAVEAMPLGVTEKRGPVFVAAPVSDR